MFAAPDAPAQSFVPSASIGDNERLLTAADLDSPTRSRLKTSIAEFCAKITGAFGTSLLTSQNKDKPVDVPDLHLKHGQENYLPFYFLNSNFNQVDLLIF